MSRKGTSRENGKVECGLLFERGDIGHEVERNVGNDERFLAPCRRGSLEPLHTGLGRPFRRA